MAADKDALKTLLLANIDSEFASISVPGVTYNGPLAQPNPAYYQKFCEAIATGIAEQKTITATTTDDGLTGTPAVAGTGVGIGILVNALDFEERIYTHIRNFVIADYGQTSHPIYSAATSDNFLKQLAKAVAESVQEHFETVWTYATNHPDVYSGEGIIEEGNFSGLVEATIKAAMQAAGGGLLNGSFWPRFCEAMSKAYVETIHLKAKDFDKIIISGTCTPTPIPPQVCGVPGTGSGSGTAT